MSDRRKHVNGAKSASAQTLVQMVYDRAADKESAVTDLVVAAEGSATLRDYLIMKGAHAAIGERIRSDNARIFQDRPDADVTLPRIRMVESPLISGKHKARMRATAATLRLMAVVLPNGVRMASAKRGDVQDAVDTYAPQAADMLHKAAYYRAVLAKLPDGKRVDEVFDDKGLTALYEGTRVGVDAPQQKAA